MAYGTNWPQNAIWAAKRFKEPAGASEFGGAPGPDAHAHADPPPTHVGYPGRHVPISDPQSPCDVVVSPVGRGRGRVT